METNTFPLELLTNDNYADWSVKMKNKLLAQGLWDIVETGLEPHELDDDKVEYEARRKMNDAALHAIQSSCSMDILSRIKNISSSKTAWKVLGKIPMGSNGQEKLIQTEGDNSTSSHNSDNMETNTLPLKLPIGSGANQRVESGNSSDNQGRSNSSNISGNGQNTIIQTEDDNLIIDEGNSSSSHKSDLKLPKPDDDEVKYENWRKMNDAVLCAIQSSCGMDILSQINKINSAKIAWETLGKIVMESNGQEKLIQTEDDNSIIDEGNPSSSHNPGPEIREDDNFGRPLLMALRRGDWNCIREFLELHPHALTTGMPIFHGHGTILHAAVDAEREHIVEELVNMISEHDLKKQDDFGYTALHISGNQRVAECLIRKNQRLVSIRNNGNLLPVALAMSDGHKELARYLYSQTPFQDLEANRNFNGASLLNSCFYQGDLDMALDLMERCPRLAFALDGRRKSPLEVLAEISTDAFEQSGNYKMVFWKQWIYNHCIHISLDRAADQFRLNIQNHGQENTTGPVGADLWRQLVSSLFNLLGFKHLYEMKFVRAQFQQLLTLMCEESQRNQYKQHIIMRALFSAIKRGNFEFVYHIVKANPYDLWTCDGDGRGIFHLVILHRQHRIFSLLYSLRKRNVFLNMEDFSGNTILHMAGMVIKNTAIDSIRGAALQMQREVQWFKEVERICPLTQKEMSNGDSFTARQLFTEDHKEMRKEGEKWMKGTATSCTVVGALIITIMFAAAFTIPGGNHQDTGLPILVHDKLFQLFIVTDSLSLFSSSTSVLMFLGILTSRYAEEDFLRSLPRKMIIGLFALFFSIATMMIAFSAALLLMLRGKYQIVVPIIGLAGIPIILFVLMQFHLLVDMLVSTYRPGIFDRKKKPWI